MLSGKGRDILNQLGILILSVLAREKVNCNASAMTSYEITDEMQHIYRADSIYRNMVKLKKLEYVKEGYKDGKANTYYITQKGLEALEDARKAG